MTGLIFPRKVNSEVLVLVMLLKTTAGSHSLFEYEVEKASCPFLWTERHAPLSAKGCLQVE